MDGILKIMKKENGPRALSAPALELNTIIFKHVYWYMQQISGERLQDHWSSVFFFFFKVQLVGLSGDFPLGEEVGIRKTCPCNTYPLKPHCYKEKLGYAGVNLFLLQNIDCGYSLEPPRRGGSNVYPQSMF